MLCAALVASHHLLTWVHWTGGTAFFKAWVPGHGPSSWPAALHLAPRQSLLDSLASGTPVQARIQRLEAQLESLQNRLSILVSGPPIPSSSSCYLPLLCPLGVCGWGCTGDVEALVHIHALWMRGGPWCVEAMVGRLP